MLLIGSEMSVFRTESIDLLFTGSWKVAAFMQLLFNVGGCPVERMHTIISLQGSTISRIIIIYTEIKIYQFKPVSILA